MENGLSKWIPIRILKPDWNKEASDSSNAEYDVEFLFVHAKTFSTVGVGMVIPSSPSIVNILLPLPTEHEPDLN